LLQFDLTRLSPGLTANNIAKATLTLFASEVDAPGTLNIAVANGQWTDVTSLSALGADETIDWSVTHPTRGGLRTHAQQ
jgi:hypothetical protein